MNFPGIIGTGVHALQWYMEQLQELSRSAEGKDVILPTKIIGIPFTPINTLLPYQMEKAGEQLFPYFEEMERFNNAPYILANITLHEALDKMKSTFTPSTHFIHLSDLLKEQPIAEGEKIMVIGTEYTMTHNYIPRLLLLSYPRIKIVRPTQDEIEKLDELRTLFYSTPSPEKAKIVFNGILENHPDTTFVIACTEHALALKYIEDQSRFINLPKEQCRALLTSYKNMTHVAP